MHAYIHKNTHTHTHSVTKAYSHSRWHFSLLGTFYSCNIKFLRRESCCVSHLMELIIPKSTCIPAQLSTSNSRSLLFKYMVSASAVVCEDKIVNIISIFSGHQGGQVGREVIILFANVNSHLVAIIPAWPWCSVLYAWSSSCFKRNWLGRVRNIKVAASDPLSWGRTRKSGEGRKIDEGREGEKEAPGFMPSTSVN